MLANKGGVGHAHQGVGQRYDRQEVLRGDGPGNAVRPLSHDVAQSQSQTSSQRQLLQQRLLAKGRITEYRGIRKVPKIRKESNKDSFSPHDRRRSATLKVGSMRDM